MGRRRRRRQWLCGLAAAAALAALAAAWWHASQRLPKRFAAVVAGRLYRSGAVKPQQLAYLARHYGIRTVISLLDARDPLTARERAAVRRLGLRWYNVPLPGNGATTAAQRARLKALLLDPTLGPTLVHCAAGTNRTGLAVGLYRLHRQGWTLARVLEEMRRFGFEDRPRHSQLRAALAAEAASVGSTRPAAPVQPDAAARQRPP